MTTANDFGLVPESVRSHHFPNSDTWAASSRPSSTAVTEAIAEEAGRMAGALALELIDAGAITDTASSAYVHCRKVLRLQVASRVAKDMLGQSPEVTRTWDAEVAKFYVELGAGGATYLGDGATATGTADADGPNTHINRYSLTTDVGTNMSDTVPMCRKDDQL